MMLDKGFGSHVAQQGQMGLSNNTAGNDTSTAMTQVSSTQPTLFVDVHRSQQTKEATMQSPDDDKDIADYDLRVFVDPEFDRCPAP